MSRAQIIVATLVLCAVLVLVLFRQGLVSLDPAAEAQDGEAGSPKRRTGTPGTGTGVGNAGAAPQPQRTGPAGSRAAADEPASLAARKVASLGSLNAGLPPFTFPELPIAAPSADLSYAETGPVEEAPEQVNPSPASASECGAVTAAGTCVKPLPDDADADGYKKDRDCDDLLAEVHPGAREQRCNQIDEDCDGTDLCPEDRDGDHSYADQDCDDRNPKRHPLAQEIFCNGVDEDCSGFDACDRDQDGDPAPHDCDDRAVTSHHGAHEIACDGIDQDCNGSDCCSEDADGDGHPCRSDCNDNHAGTHPGAPTPPGCYTRDLNCDGQLDGTDCT